MEAFDVNALGVLGLDTAGDTIYQGKSTFVGILTFLDKCLTQGAKDNILMSWFNGMH